MSAENQPDGTKAGDHFPLDSVLLKPLSHKSRALLPNQTRGTDKPKSGFNGGTSLLNCVVEAKSNPPRTQAFVARLKAPSTVNHLRIFFSDHSTALFSLDIVVTVGRTIVYHRTLSEAAFARFVRSRRSGQSSKDGSDGN